MSRLLSTLDPEFRPLADKLLARIEKNGLNAFIVFTSRAPVEQGALWRQGRSGFTVKGTIRRLRKGSWFERAQADALEAAGAQKRGEVVTWALPYESPHQFGYAIDLCPVVNGVPMWNRLDLFRAFGEIGRDELGLEWGGSWETKPDFGHFELPEWRTRVIRRMLP